MHLMPERSAAGIIIITAVADTSVMRAIGDGRQGAAFPPASPNNTDLS
jgi:hypothetical protein